MKNTLKALELLGLPEAFAPYEGQVQTRVNRSFRIYENYDFTSGKLNIYYTVEKAEDVTQLFGMYPFNYLAGAIYHMGFVYEGETDEGSILISPSKFVRHEVGSLAGQNVYYNFSKIVVNETTIDYIYEPYQTVINGKAEDMKDPIITAPYYGRTIKKGADGKPRIAWQSRYPMRPKRQLRRAEFLKVAKMTMDQYMFESRTSWNIVKTNPETHITSVSVDLEKNENQFTSRVYINGRDAKTFDYKTLINSYGQKYGGFFWQWRLYNGQPTTPNAYGSTINIAVIPGENETITVQTGGVNSYDANSKILTYNPNLEPQAKILSYMEFLPANGKNENTGREFNLESGLESLY